MKKNGIRIRIRTLKKCWIWIKIRPKNLTNHLYPKTICFIAGRYCLPDDSRNRTLSFHQSELINQRVPNIFWYQTIVHLIDHVTSKLTGVLRIEKVWVIDRSRPGLLVDLLLGGRVEEAEVLLALLEPLAVNKVPEIQSQLNKKSELFHVLVPCGWVF